MRPLGLDHFTFIDMAPADLARLAASIGYAHVGFRLHPPVPGELHHCPPTPADVRALRTVLDGEGIALHDVETFVIDERFDADAARPVIDVAVALGARRLSVSAEDQPGVADRLARLATHAAAAGLGVDLEPMAWRGIDTLTKARDLIAASGAANVAILVDSLHLERGGEGAADVAALDPRLVASVQLCDAPAETPPDMAARIAEARGGRRIPGDGGLDLTGLLAVLPAGAVLSVEVPMAHDPRTRHDRAQAIFEATARLVAGQPTSRKRECPA